MRLSLNTLLTMICLIVSVNLFSTVANNMPVELQQPDGTFFNAFMTGHNRFVRYHDKDNYTMIRDKDTGFYCWAIQAPDGSLESTGYNVNLYDPKTLKIKPGEDSTKEWRRQQPKSNESSTLDDRSKKQVEKGKL